jgi:hypothetical protein
MDEIHVNLCKLVVISKISPLFLIIRDFGSLPNPSTPPCINPLLRGIKNHIDFYILTPSNYMFNNLVIQFVVFFLQSTKIHSLLRLIMLSPCILFSIPK